MKNKKQLRSYMVLSIFLLGVKDLSAASVSCLELTVVRKKVFHLFPCTRQWRDLRGFSTGTFENSPKLVPYQSQLAQARVVLKQQLARAQVDAGIIATKRRSIEIMDNQLQKSPKAVLGFERMPSNQGQRGPELWQAAAEKKAKADIFPEIAKPEEYKQTIDEYTSFCKFIKQKGLEKPIVTSAKEEVYIYEENAWTNRIREIIADELMIWIKKQDTNSFFYRVSPQAGLAQMLSERPDLIALARMSQPLLKDREVGEAPISRPLVVDLIEISIGLVPVVGNAVAAYEAYSGKDLFGYHLSNLERGILAASVFLPVAGKFVKYGKAVYSEARMAKLYGRKASEWSLAFAASKMVTTEGKLLQSLEKAEASLVSKEALSRESASEISEALSQLIKESRVVSKEVEPIVGELLVKLSSKHKILKGLDNLALQRVLEKGSNVDHLKGQLLEELLEADIVSWLRKKTGSLALGIASAGKKLEFIPGHLIRDLKGRQITDGIIAYQKNGVLEIVAIFEAKAGKKAARELSITSGTISSLTKGERAELRAYAKDVLREEVEIARLESKTLNKSIEDVEREIILTEQGGQIRRDIERLYKSEINIGGVRTPVNFSPKEVKFFGVIPKDVNPTLIEKELAEIGVTYETRGIDITQRDLVSIAEELAPHAEALALKP